MEIDVEKLIDLVFITKKKTYRFHTLNYNMIYIIYPYINHFILIEKEENYYKSKLNL